MPNGGCEIAVEFGHLGIGEEFFDRAGAFARADWLGCGIHFHGRERLSTTRGRCGHGCRGFVRRVVIHGVGRRSGGGGRIVADFKSDFWVGRFDDYAGIEVDRLTAGLHGVAFDCEAIRFAFWYLRFNSRRIGHRLGGFEISDHLSLTLASRFVVCTPLIDSFPLSRFGFGFG